MNLKKKLTAGLLALASLSTLLAPVRNVLAEDSTWGLKLKEAAETVLVTKLFSLCYKHTNNQKVENAGSYKVSMKHYITTGWSLFMEADKTAFDVGSWLEESLSVPFGDGEVYCYESPDGAGYDDNNGSEIIRLLSLYLLGSKDTKVMREQLFCNKNNTSQPGLTLPLIDKKTNNIANNCAVFEDNIYHALLQSGINTVGGTTYNYGLNYVKELYNEKRNPNNINYNRFLPAWDDIDDAILNNKALRYYMFLNDYDAGECMADPLTYGGNRIKLVDPATGDISEQGFKERKKDDYDGVGDDDWDKIFYQIAKGDGYSGTDEDGNCQDKYPGKINELAAEASFAIRNASGAARDENAKNTIEECYNSARDMLYKARVNNNITLLEQPAKLSDGTNGIIRDVMKELFSRVYYDVINKKSISQNYSIDTIKDVYFDSEGKLKESSARNILNRIKDENTWSSNKGILSLENVTSLVDSIDNAIATILPVMIMTDEEFSAKYTGDKSTFIDENIKIFYDGVKDYVNKVAPLLGGAVLSFDATANKYNYSGGLSYEESGYYVFEQYFGYNKDVQNAFSKEQSFTGGQIVGNNPGVTRVFYFDDTNSNKIYDYTIKKVVDVSTVYRNGTITADMIENDRDNICPFGKNFRADAEGKLDLEGVDFNFDLSNINQITPGKITTNDDDNNTLADRCEGASPLSWILCPAIKLIANGAEAIYEDQIAPQLQVQSTDLKYDADHKESGTYGAWRYAVSVANILLVILFIVVIVSQLTGYGIDNYGIKKILPKIIVVAILINLSFVICQLAADVSNILGANIQKWLESIPVRNTSEATVTSWTLPGVIGNLLAFVGIASVGVVVAKTIKQKSILESIAALLIPLLIIFISILIAVVFFFILLGVRRAGIIALVVLSPLAIVCYALPNTKKYYTKWYNGFKALLVLYPICSLLVGVSNLVAKIINANSNDFVMQLVSAAILVYPYFLIPKLVSKTIQSVTNLGDFISGIGRGLKKGSANALRNSDWAKNYQDRVKANAENRQKQRALVMADRNVNRSARRVADMEEKYKNMPDGWRKRALEGKLDREKALKKANEDKGLALQNERNEARERAAYDIKHAAPGESYYQKASEAQRIIAHNAAINRESDMERPPVEMSMATARKHAEIRQDAEMIKTYKEQFSDKSKKELQGLLENEFANPDNQDKNKWRALASLLNDQGAQEELTNAVLGMNRAKFTNIMQDDASRNAFMSLLSNSGSDILAGFGKHIGEHKQFSSHMFNWLNDDRQNASKTDSFRGYLEGTYSEGDLYAKMTDDDFKVLATHTNGADTANYYENLAKYVSSDSLIKAVAGKRGKERTPINTAIRQKLNNMINDKINADPTLLGRPMDATREAVNELIEGGDINTEMLPALDDATLDALAGIDRKNDTPDVIKQKDKMLRDALGSLVPEARADQRIWNKMSNDIRKRLDPTWKTDFRNMTVGDWQSMLPDGTSNAIFSQEAQDLRESMKDDIAAFKKTDAWKTLDENLKNCLDPTWRLDNEATFSAMTTADWDRLLPTGINPVTSSEAQAIRSQMVDKVAALKETAAWAAASAGVKDRLDPSWRLDDAAGISGMSFADWDNLLPSGTTNAINSPEAQAMREQHADVIAAFKASPDWGTADPRLKTRLDPTWKETEDRDEAFNSAPQPGTLNDIKAEATHAYNSSALNDFIQKVGFNSENIFNMKAHTWDAYAGGGSDTIHSPQADALRAILNPIIETIPMQDWGKFDAGVLDRLRPGWRYEVQKANAIGRTGQALADMNDIIVNQITKVIGDPAKYAQAIKNSNISEADLSNMDASTVLSYAGGATAIGGNLNHPQLVQLRTELATQITALENDPVHWSQIPIPKRDILDPNWRTNVKS